MDQKELFGLISVILSFLAYLPYLRDLYLKKIKPHVFSWFIWGLIDAIAVTAQVLDGAGAGAWTLTFGMIAAFSITVMSLKHGETNITRSDWISFIAALGAVLVWLVTDDPTGAVILVVLIDILGFIPTFRKSFNRPYDETLSTWVMNSLKFVLGLYQIT